uniref:TPR_REGION domain-containing protein n=1 Tax=Caenorhabditis tropicalis TaxID=1561998 RepID=A0A1I7TPW4_9PELO
MPRGRVPTIVRRTRSSASTPMGMLRRPISVWKHLKILCDHNYAEDSILLYEITNQSTSSDRWVVPENNTDYETYIKVCELYDKTKRYAQAGAILRSIIQTFPNQRPFSCPSTSTHVPEEERVELSANELEQRDYIWYCYYCILQKSNKLKEAHEALRNVRGPAYKKQRDDEMPRLLHQMKYTNDSDLVIPEQWRAELPDENSARICSSSLGPIMSLLKQNKADATLVKRFSEQFIGTERNDVYWWLKSYEAIGKDKPYEAIACLKKMSHQNPRVLTEMARLNYQIDKRDEARRLLRTAHSIDCLWIDGMDLLAFLCIGDFATYSNLIEGLATTLSREWPHRIETYVVNGFMVHQMDLDMAWSYSNRAMKCAVPGTDQYVFAVHLKAYCLRTLEVKARAPDVEKHKNEAHRLLEAAVEAMPNSTDLGLLYVDTLLEDEDGHRAAKIFATKFLHQNPDNVHAKLLKVHVLVNGVTRNPDANHTKCQDLFTLLEEVIADHPHILAAYCFLLNEYSRLKKDDKCGEVLERLMKARQLISPTKTHKYHKIRADYLLKFKKVIPAYEHLMAAIATGASVDQTMMSSYESEFNTSEEISHDYKNLAFLDPVLPGRPAASAPETSPALQEVINDHENDQDSSDADDEDEEEEEGEVA